jgi:hypothetical protein
MKASTVLLIAIPVLLVLAALLAVATTVSRQRSATGSLTREARKADQSGAGASVATVDESDEARARAADDAAEERPARGVPMVEASDDTAMTATRTTPARTFQPASIVTAMMAMPLTKSTHRSA